MLQKALQNYIGEACPKLTHDEKQRLFDALLKMIHGWAAVPEGQRKSFIARAVAEIGEQIGSRKNSFSVRVKVSKRSRDIEAVRKVAEMHAVAWNAKIALVGSDIRNSTVAVEGVEEFPDEIRNYYVVKTRFYGPNISAKVVRNAYGKLKRANKLLAAAGVDYE